MPGFHCRASPQVENIFAVVVSAAIQVFCKYLPYWQHLAKICKLLIQTSNTPVRYEIDWINSCGAKQKHTEKHTRTGSVMYL